MVTAVAIAGQDEPYKIVVGLDTALLLRADRQWGEEKGRIVTTLLDDCGDLPQDPGARMALFAEYGLTDFHWDWTRKALALNGDEYIWAFLVTPNGRVQSIAIFYHPKSSRVDGSNIFYIDYIATAYWNRGRDRSRQEFSGAARVLIRYGIRHLINTAGYRPGFCLHSLPTATSYYERLGMIKFGQDAQKENLVYFEAPESVALALMEEGTQ